MIPNTNIYYFARKYKDQFPYYTISYEESVKQVSPDMRMMIKKTLCHCSNGEEKQVVPLHHYARLNVTNFIESLEPIEYWMEIPKLEKKVNRGFW